MRKTKLEQRKSDSFELPVDVLLYDTFQTFLKLTASPDIVNLFNQQILMN